RGGGGSGRCLRAHGDAERRPGVHQGAGRRRSGASRMSGPHVAVVGGGITGLATAQRLLTMANGSPIEVTVLESSDRLGGKLRTVDLDGTRLEVGADSFVVRKPWAVELAKELGLGGELVVPAASRAFVW